MGKRKIIQITVLTTLVLTLSFASASTMADAKTKNGFTYKITKNQVKIVSCSKNQKRIVIPNKIAGKKVTALGANVWKKSSKVQTVVLPKYLKTIEKKQADYAWGNIVKKKNIFSTSFTGCGKLKNIKVAKGNKYFWSAKGVLYTKNKKTLLVYPAGRTQKSYTIQGKTTQIGEAAFEYAKYLQKISYGKKLFYILDGAFFASGLRSVELAKNISNVGLYAFAYSTKLQKVTLGDKVEQINTPFIGCTNLKQFKADKKEIGYYAVNDVLYYKDKEKTYMKCYPAAKQEDSYEFPAGVNGGGLCFANCRYLKKVVYAKDSIMGQDFYECHNLTVVLPDVVVNPAIGSENDSYDGKWEPFKNCTNFILQGKKNPFMQSYAVSKGFTYSIV